MLRSAADNLSRRVYPLPLGRGYALHHYLEPTEALMNKASKTALVELVAGLAACSDGLVAPQREASVAVAGNDGGSMEALVPGQVVKFNITIDPSRQTNYYLGDGNSLSFPAHSLCSPTASSYGAGEWDKACPLATAPVTVGVTAWLDSDGHTRVDFSMHLRFVPSTNSAQWVKLVFKDLQASLDPTYNILYCPTATSGCFDESLSDPTLKTVRDPLTGRIGRRIKHFSGYNIAAGRDADSDGGGTASTSTLNQARFAVASYQVKGNSMSELKSFFRRSEVDMLLSRVEFVRRFSGYMLASG